MPLVRFRVMALMAAGFLTLLAGQFILAPVAALELFGLEVNPSAQVMLHRMSAVFIGIAILLWMLRNCADPGIRRTVSIGMAVLMVALSLSGLTDLALGLVGSGIWVAIGSECLIALGFVLVSRQG